MYLWEKESPDTSWSIKNKLLVIVLGGKVKIQMPRWCGIQKVYIEKGNNQTQNLSQKSGI